MRRKEQSAPAKSGGGAGIPESRHAAGTAGAGSPLIWAFVLVAATVLAYLPVWQAGFVWDDDAMLTANRLVKASDGLWRFWFTTEATDYWPVTYTSLWLEWRLWGMNPMGYHATNLLLHAVEVLLVWAVLVRLSIPGARLAALLFAVHPVNVESVAWIAQRKNVAALLFFLLSVWSYAKAGLLHPRECRRGFGNPWYWLSLGMFVVAVLAKGSAIILPPILLLLIWWRRKVELRDAWELAPFFAFAAAATWVNVWFQSHGAPMTVRTDGALERLLGAGAVMWFYLGKALLPYEVMFVYPRWTIVATDIRWWLPLLAALAVTVGLWRLRQGSKRPILIAWAFFGIAILPVMGFANIYFMRYSLVADHYQHIALLGVVSLVAAGWSRGREKLGTGSRAVLAAATATAIGLLAVGTYRETRTYRDEIALWGATLEKNPQSFLAHNNLGTLYLDGGKPAVAAEHFAAAVRLSPHAAETHLNLGKALAAQPGRADEAIAHFENAVRLQPNVPLARLHLANALAKIPARRDEAVAQYEALLALEPENAEAHANLALFLGSRADKLAAALAHGATAIRLKPTAPEVFFNQANTLARLPERRAEAIAHYETALQLRPNYTKAHINLGLLLSRDPATRPAAIQHYQAALALEPDSAVSHNNLAIVLAESARLAEAQTHLERALELDPSYVDARNNLARVKAMQSAVP